MSAKKIIGVVVLALILSASAGFASYYGANRGLQEAAEPPTEDQSEEIAPAVETTQVNSDSISIPGYEVIHLKADQKEQSVFLYNPARNQCYFTVALLVDGVELFRTERLEPGAELSTVTMKQKIPAGTYENAKLRYSCFDLKTMKELNGADVMLRLEVA